MHKVISQLNKKLNLIKLISLYLVSVLSLFVQTEMEQYFLVGYFQYLTPLSYFLFFFFSPLLLYFLHIRMFTLTSMTQSTFKLAMNSGLFKL